MNLSKAPGLKRDGRFLRRVAASKEAAKCVIRSKEHVGFAPQAATKPKAQDLTCVCFCHLPPRDPRRAIAVRR